MRIYNIIAGINGAGKTSLYSIIKNVNELGQRVNIDEIAADNGDWHDTLVQIKAARAAINAIERYIEQGITFNQETTLPGPTIVKLVKKAKAVGYTVNLYFVGVDDIDTAIARVHKRVLMGGHGISDNVIRKRFEKMPKNLSNLLPLCDNAFFYDNTLKFRQIAIIQNNRFLDADRELPKWFRLISMPHIVSGLLL